MFGKTIFYTLLLTLQFGFFSNQAFPTCSLWQSSQILLIEILIFFFKMIEIFLNIGLCWSENVKTLLLHFWFCFQQTFYMFSLTLSNRSYNYGNFEIANFSLLEKFEIFFNTVPYGVKSSNHCSSLSYEAFSKTLCRFSPWQSSRKLFIGILKFQI